MLTEAGQYSTNDRTQGFDETLGYRLHLITGHNHVQKFNEAAGVYGRDANGRFTLKDDDLRTRQILRAHGAEELIALMQREDTARILSSRIVFNNRAIGWGNFFLHLGKPERYAALVDRLRNAPKDRQDQVVLMECVVDKMPSSRYFDSRFSFHAQPIDIGRENRAGRKEYVVPGIRVEHNHNTHLQQIFNPTGRYFILGVVRLNSQAYDHAVNHYFNITVTDVRQVHSGNIHDISLAAKNNAARRAKLKTETPSAP